MDIFCSPDLISDNRNCKGAWSLQEFEINYNLYTINFDSNSSTEKKRIEIFNFRIFNKNQYIPFEMEMKFKRKLSRIRTILINKIFTSWFMIGKFVNSGTIWKSYFHTFFTSWAKSFVRAWTLQLLSRFIVGMNFKKW